VTLMSDDSPTFAHVFTLSEKIKLNMVEERVVTSGFSRDTTTTSHGQQSTWCWESWRSSTTPIKF
jgi:hypothetical protein